MQVKPGGKFYILVALMLLFWGSFTAISKLILGGLDGYQVLFLIFLSASVTMTIQISVKGAWGQFKAIRKKDFAILAVCGILLFLYYFLYVRSLEFAPAVEAAMINYLFPLFVVLFAAPINKEKLTPVKIISAVICFAGVVIIITGGTFADVRLSNLPGDILALSAAIAWGLFSNFGRKHHTDPLVSQYIFVIISCILSLISLSVLSSFRIPSVFEVAGCLWLGFSNIAISLQFWFRIIKLSSASTAANFAFFTPFVTVLFIAALTDEAITIAAIAGMLLIVAGNVTASIKLKNNNPNN